MSKISFMPNHVVVVRYILFSFLTRCYRVINFLFLYNAITGISCVTISKKDAHGKERAIGERELCTHRHAHLSVVRMRAYALGGKISASPTASYDLFRSRYFLFVIGFLYMVSSTTSNEEKA